MGARSKSAKRCSDCRMHVADCICSLMPHLKLETKVIVVMHHREWSKSTATAPLFAQAAPDNCKIRLRGLKDAPFDGSDIIDSKRQTLLLYPLNNAQILTKELVASDDRAVTLVVPDGNWRQAAKAAQKDPDLNGLKTVILPDMGPSRYRLRTEPKKGGLATFEAIARALRILEGEDVYQALDTIFTLMVERTLATRGIRPT